MKRFLFSLLFAAAAVAVSAAPQKVAFDKLPRNSQEFVQKNFPNEKIKAVEMDRESSWDKYTVYFNSGNRISFEGGSGDWSEIVMESGQVPYGAIPSKVKSYAGSKYSGQKIVMLKTTADGYEAKLSDGTILSFDKDGDFVKAAK